MTKPLMTLPCTAQELENALHAACDHDGLWGAKVRIANVRMMDYGYYALDIETEMEGEMK